MNQAEVEQCYVCGGTASPQLSVVSFEAGEHFEIVVCTTCGLGQTSPQPIDLDKYYAGYHGGRHGFTARFRAWSRSRILNRCLDPADGAKSVLDVGCGDGDFLLSARNSGWLMAGTERGERISDIDGVRVLPDLAAVREEFGDSSFDAITFWHSLEHFDDPAATLADINALLSEKGVLLIAVPDFGGWQSRLFGKHWLHLDVPRHLWHFTADSLKQLLERHGFSVKGVRHCEFEYDVLGWSQSCLNAIFQTPNVFFHLLSGKAANVPSLSKLSNFVLGSLLSAISLPFVLVGSLAGRGGTLVVEAVKFDNSTQISAK